MRERLRGSLPALLLLALAIGMLTIASTFPPPDRPHDPGSAALPRVVAGTMAVLSIWQVLRQEDASPLPTAQRAARVVTIAGLMVLYALLLESLGFLLVTALFTMATLLAGGVRHIVWLTVLPLGVSFGLFVFFVDLMRVTLPHGLIEGVLPW